jgi:hypothetical protein
VNIPWIIIKPAKIKLPQSEHANIFDWKLASRNSLTKVKHVNNITKQQSVGRANVTVYKIFTTTDEANPSAMSKSKIPTAGAIRKGAVQYRACVNLEFS